ncbi:YciI family protein [Gimesia fumaroli]|uniref:YCII-related domain protein n=1 Tax=Gimesia fumaroli TaxID=2527976 RepID=A0A518IA29_9PLAN|nr:YciI family protein [Gimesia fumaroli]QDV49852.1 YCII-related domain protein [Gimesia fumaroli]
MAKFMFLLRSGGIRESSSEKTPEEMQQMMQMYMDWMQEGTEAGWILDPGNRLGAGAVVKPDMTVIDGPFAETKELVGGYMVVETPDLAAAIEIAKGSPMVKGGNIIEVRELPDKGMDNE